MYTTQTGLPIFDRAALITNENLYYSLALISIVGHQTFRCRLVNIGLNHKQWASKSFVLALKCQ